MQFEPLFQTVNATLTKIQISDHVKSEVKTEISSENVKKILNVGVFPTVLKNQVEDSKIKYLARTVFYICYLDQADQIKKFECSNEFSGEIACEDCPSRAVVHLTVEKTEADLSGINLKVSALVSIKAVIPKQAEIKALVDGEQLVCNNKEKSLKRGFGIKEGTYPIEEQFTLPYCVEEVLYHRAEPVITAVQCGVGCIIIDGEVILSAILLQKGEKIDIIKENKKFAYRVEMEYEDAMPSFTAISNVCLKSFKTDVEVDDEGGKSQVSLSAMLAFSSQAFSMETVSVTTDVFCLSHEIQTEKSCIAVCDVDDVRSCSYKTNLTFSCDENSNEVTLKAIAGEKIEVLNACAVNNELSFMGTFTATAYFINAENRLFTRKIDLPLEFKCDCSIEDGCFIDVMAVSDCTKCSLTANGVEFDLDVTLTIYPTKQKEFACITDIKPNGEKTLKQCAISVYIPYQGEELWSLAKRLNVHPDTLEQTNPDLKFPLDGTERIVIYRQI